MRKSEIIIIFGTIVAIVGMIFHLQGQAVVGPESSFMYSNPDWITYGQQIAVFGVLIACFGIGLKITKKG